MYLYGSSICHKPYVIYPLREAADFAEAVKSRALELEALKAAKSALQESSGAESFGRGPFTRQASPFCSSRSIGRA